MAFGMNPNVSSSVRRSRSDRLDERTDVLVSLNCLSPFFDPIWKFFDPPSGLKTWFSSLGRCSKNWIKFSSLGRRFSSLGRRFSSLGRRFSSPGRWFSSPGRWFSSPGPWFSSPGRWFSSLGQWFSSPGQWFSSPGRRFSSPGQWFSSPDSTKNLIDLNIRFDVENQCRYLDSEIESGSSFSIQQRRISEFVDTTETSQTKLRNERQ